MYVFKMIETHDLFGGRTSYGILAKSYEGGVMQDAAIIPGFSYDKEFVLGLLERCERNQLSPLHLFDVVTDALS